MAVAVVAALVAAITLALPACGGSENDESSAEAAKTAGAGDPSKDKLAQVLGRGTLILSTDPEYPPQSFLVKGAQRPPILNAPPTS